MQVVGSFSRVGLSLYTYVPPNQTGTFSDSGALNRAVQRPANAFDAFRRAAEEGLSGLWSGISGTLMDPTQVRTSDPQLYRIWGPKALHLASDFVRVLLPWYGISESSTSPAQTCPPLTQVCCYMGSSGA